MDHNLILADMNFSGEIHQNFRKEKVNCIKLWNNMFMMLLPLYIPYRCLCLHYHCLQTNNFLNLKQTGWGIALCLGNDVVSRTKVSMCNNAYRMNSTVRGICSGSLMDQMRVNESHDSYYNYKIQCSRVIVNHCRTTSEFPSMNINSNFFWGCMPYLKSYQPHLP